MAKRHWTRKGVGTGSRDNQTWFEENGCKVFKSYAAIIGFTDRKGVLYATDETWSQSTSRHQGDLQACHDYPGDPRIPEEEFKALYDKVVIQGIDKDEEIPDDTPMFG